MRRREIEAATLRRVRSCRGDILAIAALLGVTLVALPPRSAGLVGTDGRLALYAEDPEPTKTRENAFQAVALAILDRSGASWTPAAVERFARALGNT